MNPIEGEERATRAEKLARLSDTCRQMSGMMEAGVDILRITRVLRSQTEDEDILRLCERIDYDLKQGRAISDALADEPGLFSPFAVTLVRQGEERSNLALAFARVAQAFDHERQELAQPLIPAEDSTAASRPQTLGAAPQVLAASAPGAQESQGAPASPWPAPAAWLESAQARWVSTASGVGAGLLAASAASEALVALGVLPAKWQRPLARALSAGVLAATALASRRREGPRAEVYAAQGPQVLAPPVSASGPAPEAAAPSQEAPRPTVTAHEAPVALAPAVPVPTAPRPEPNAVYRGAPRDDEEEERRIVKRPPQEEEFD